MYNPLIVLASSSQASVVYWEMNKKVREPSCAYKQPSKTVTVHHSIHFQYLKGVSGSTSLALHSIPCKGVILPRMHPLYTAPQLGHQIHTNQVRVCNWQLMVMKSRMLEWPKNVQKKVIHKARVVITDYPDCGVQGGETLHPLLAGSGGIADELPQSRLPSHLRNSFNFSHLAATATALGRQSTVVKSSTKQKGLHSKVYDSGTRTNRQSWKLSRMTINERAPPEKDTGPRFADRRMSVPSPSSRSRNQLWSLPHPAKSRCLLVV